MEEIVKRISDVSKKLQPLKQAVEEGNDSVMIEALNALTEDQRKGIGSYLNDTSCEKINKLRQDVLARLEAVGHITLDEVEQIKADVNEEYPAKNRAIVISGV